MFDDIFKTLHPGTTPDFYPSDHPDNLSLTDNPYQFLLEILPDLQSDPFIDLPPSAFAELGADMGTPAEDAAYWHPQQGSNSCAIVAQLSVYESITGIELSEDTACQIAESHGWFDPETGTPPSEMGKLLAALGISTYQAYDATLEDIATALEEGDKVIVGLDANEIWQPVYDPVDGTAIEQENGGHAVWVTGIEQTDDGSVQIILNDSGTPDGQRKVVDATDFLNAWQDYGNFLVVADTPNPTG